MDATRLVVIKVGGSLLGWDEFPARMNAYLESCRAERLVLVIGGGKAADFVRELDSLYRIGEKRSHGLALRALDLTAWIVAALVPGLVVVERPEELTQVWDSGLVPVLAPRWFTETLDRRTGSPLVESWEVTTDSIAARLAHDLRAGELRLLKSTGPGNARSRAQAAAIGLVDPAFPEVSASIPRLTLVNLRESPPTTNVLE